MPDQPTLWDIARTLDRIEEEQRSLRQKVDATFVRQDVYRADNDLRKLVDETAKAWRAGHEDTHRWIGRTIGSALILTLANVIVVLARLG
jgi:hypothetical protein